MTMHSSDAALVAGHLAGDPGALAGIYDRYCDPLHDTAAAMLNDRGEAADVLHDVILIAAERLGQLRDPDRLKPWLFAILRNEVYRRTKQRRRTIATDFSGSDDGYDVADDRHLDLSLHATVDAAVDPSTGVADAAAHEDLAELVRNAARGLDDRDQLVLELSVRQGLGGQDLADALGVTANQSYTLVHRMRERVGRSLTAYVVAKAGRNDCDDLDQLLAKWDGEFSVLVRKRVARHVDACEVCDTRRRKVAPLAMFASAPVYAAPAALRDRILQAARAQTPPPATPYQFSTTDGFPKVVRTARRVAAWVAPIAAASLILVTAGLGIAFADRGEGDNFVRDEAFVAVTNSPSTATTAIVTPPAVVPERGGATNDTLPAISTTVLPIATTAAVPPTAVPPIATTTGDSLPAAEPPAPKPAPTARPTIAPPVAPPAATPATPRPTRTTPPGNAPPPAAPPAPPTPPPNPAATPPPTPPPTAPPTAPPAPTPGQLSVGAGSISLGSGSGASSGSVELTNVGEMPVTYSVGGNTGPFSVAPQSGTLDGGASASVTATIDRSNLGEGSGPAGNITISGGDGSSFAVSLSAQVERAPVVSQASATGSCSSSVQISASAGIFDESSVTASFSVSGPNGQSASDAMSRDGGTWFGFVSIPYPPNEPGTVTGTWSWSIAAADSRGNTSISSGSTPVAC